MRPELRGDQVSSHDIHTNKLAYRDTRHRPNGLCSIGPLSSVALQAEFCQSTALTQTAASEGLNKALCLLCHPHQLYTRPGV